MYKIYIKKLYFIVPLLRKEHLLVYIYIILGGRRINFAALKFSGQPVFYKAKTTVEKHIHI